jgi:hypothetical protein
MAAPYPAATMAAARKSFFAAVTESSPTSVPLVCHQPGSSRERTSDRFVRELSNNSCAGMSRAA